jgi:methionyl-tRNA formyltransferase
VKGLRIAFAGTGTFAVPVLTALAKECPPVLVITQPDRPAGRGLKPQLPPVKLAAAEMGLAVFQPASINGPDAVEKLRELNLDLLVVAAYGQILKKRVLELPRLGCVNVHASLLPKYRGAAPVAWAILNGERITGVTVFLMDEGMDTGPILLQRPVEIRPEETRGELEARLAEVGGELVVKAVADYAAGKLVPKPQPREGTRAPLLKKDLGQIDWSWPATKVHNWIRGLNPWPCAFTSFRGKKLRLLRSRLAAAGSPTFPPGSILPERGRLVVACGEGAVELLEVQLAGKRRLSGRDFLNGYRPGPGERLGT